MVIAVFQFVNCAVYGTVRSGSSDVLLHGTDNRQSNDKQFSLDVR